MRKISLEAYLVDGINEEGKLGKVPYDVKTSLIAILFHRELNLNATEVLNRDDLAKMIRDHKEKEILLEEGEYEMIKQAVNVVRGYGRNDVEFVRRIIRCPRIEVEEKKK